MSYDYRYKVVEKEVRGKLRTLYIPDHALATKQRELIPFLETLPVHPAAIAYVKGRTLNEAVYPHFNMPNVVTLDLSGFFQSITASAIFSALRSHVSYTRAKRLTSLVTYKGHLPFGAPTSPIISNIVFYSTDLAIADCCSFLGINFTRYADDMVFSYHQDMTGRYILTIIAPIIDRFGYKLNINKIRYNPKRILGIEVLYPTSTLAV